MRLRIFIALVSLLSTVQAFACWGPRYTPANYYTFRAWDDAEETGLRRRNCQLWQRQTSMAIPIEDIESVVYKFSHADLMRVSQLIGAPEAMSSLMGNKFVSWLVQRRDKDIIDFLLLAKICEQTRFEMASPWYYPVEGDDASTTLTKITERAKSYTGTRLRDRYALQAVRAMLATYQYEELINFWNDSAIPEGLMREMIMPYVAGAYYRTGAVERAKRIYAECGDISSLLFCEDKKLDDIGEIKLAYQYSPDSPVLAQLVQWVVRGHERDGDRWNELQALYDFAQMVITEGKAADLALWYYTAAFLADAKGDPQTASRFVTKALAVRGSTFIKESARVLQILVDAKTQPLNAAYEQRLLGQLRWLDSKIVADLSEKIIEHTLDSWDMRNNISYYYWNDMLRKIALGVLAPRYVEQGNPVRAIQLANMADHRLQNLVDKTPKGNDYFAKHRQSTSYWNPEYSTDMFDLIDSLGVNHAIVHTQRLRHPQGVFDRFLNEHGLTDLDYFNEIIGTLCLRAMRYADAVSYLERVPTSFQYTLNVWREGFMWRDPFDGNGRPWTRITDRADYKLRFARQMVYLERQMHRDTDSNRRAQAQIRYAVGMYNSVYGAWALTQYGRSSNRDGMPEVDRKRLDLRHRKLIREALAMFTDDETAAQAYLYLGSGKQIMARYSSTKTAKHLRGHCDNLSDYSSHWR